MTTSYLITSESVTEGHPDKVCDQISDAILDAVLTLDPQARVAIECAATTGLLLIFGELTTTANIDMQHIARQVIKDIGYSGAAGGGFDANSCGILLAVDKQSPDIAQGVSSALEKRADKSSEYADTIGVLVGSPARNPRVEGKDLFNAAFFLYEKEIKAEIHKTLLPTYDVFDEYRYFEPSFEWNIIPFKEKKLAVTIC